MADVQGWITQVSPLRVVVDGATRDSPAERFPSAVFVVGDRVEVSTRNPVMPLVREKVEEP